jgi:hypothetical protein
MDPREAFHPASPQWGSMVSPAAVVVTGPTPELITTLLSLIRSAPDSEWLDRTAEQLKWAGGKEWFGEDWTEIVAAGREARERLGHD